MLTSILLIALTGAFVLGLIGGAMFIGSAITGLYRSLTAPRD